MKTNMVTSVFMLQDMEQEQSGTRVEWPRAVKLLYSEEGNAMSYSPERMSFALEEAVPRGLEAEQLY